MKRFYLLICFILITSFQLTAQRLGLRKNSWRIGLMGSVDYCYRFIGYKSGEDASREIIADRKSETALLGYTFGVNASKRLIEDLLRLNIGVVYASRSFENINNTTSLQIGSPISQIREYDLYNYQFIQIPFRLDFYVLNKTMWGLYIPLGASPGFLIGAKVKETFNYSDGSTLIWNLGDESFPYNHINLSASLGIGIDYHFSKSFVMWAQPQFEYYIINLTRNNFYWEKLYSLSLNLGISFKFDDRGLYRK